MIVGGPPRHAVPRNIAAPPEFELTVLLAGMPAMPDDKSRAKIEPQLSRRTLLLGSMAAAPIPMLDSAQARGPASQPAPDPRQPLYRETEHVRTFYDRSRF